MFVSAENCDIYLYDPWLCLHNFPNYVINVYLNTKRDKGYAMGLFVYNSWS
jgi:hypothetical protein